MFEPEPGQQRPPPDRRSQTGGKGAGACYKCGQPGHLSRDCRQGGNEGRNNFFGTASQGAESSAPEVADGGKKGGKGGSKKGGGKGGKDGKDGKGGKKGGKSKKGKTKDGKSWRTPPVTGYRAAGSSELEQDPLAEDAVDHHDDAQESSDDGKEPVKREIDTAGHVEYAAESIKALAEGSYECLICVLPIKSRQAVWDCKRCFKIIHLTCAKAWGKNSQGGFRCPQCSEPYPAVPNKYWCFCRKTKNPADDGYSTPHSCGEKCNRIRGETCPHRCPTLCHPGPCPPCPEMGPVKKCHCGALEFQNKCGEPDEGRSCGNKCLRLLNCGKHYCQKVCHEGACDPCAVRFAQKCYCGQVLVADRICDGSEAMFTDDEEESEEGDSSEEDSGDDIPRTFQCEKKCNKIRDCGKHKCERPCHVGKCPPCHLTPAKVSTCPCGKKPLHLLTKRDRTSCTDPIPCCNAQCGRQDSCEKHPCQLRCHEGDCGPCKAQVSVPCRCGGSNLKLQCSVFEALQGPAKCTRRCGAIKTCGRHKCNEVCCATSKGGEGGNHTCNDMCRKKLECGTHFCEDRCHPGPCQPCRHIVTTELTCRCGDKVLEPPQPCGTKPPLCDLPCTLPYACGHTPTPHECHYGPCPICPVRVEKRCAGDHISMVVTCHVKEPTCGAECGKDLPCGRHKCRERCHGGPCPAPSLAPGLKKGNKAPDPAQSCLGVCGAELACEHTCQLPCHAKDVSHTKLCMVSVDISCKCGRLKKTTECHKYYTQMRASAGKRGGRGMVRPTIPCDDDCAHVNRLEGMREAFGIDKTRESGQAFSNSLTPLTSVVYTQNLWLANQQMPSHIQTVQRSFYDLIIGAYNSKMTPAMNKEKRAVYHALAPYYKLGCTAVDSEPNRSCEITKNAMSAIPKPLLSEWKEDPLELAQSGKEYVVAFMQTDDCRHCVAFLTREKPAFSWRLFSDHQAITASRSEAAATRVVQGASRRVRPATSSEPGPSAPNPAAAAPTASNNAGAAVWGNFLQTQRKKDDKAPPAGVQLSANKCRGYRRCELTGLLAFDECAILD
eukprot:gene23236-35609_t